MQPNERTQATLLMGLLRQIGVGPNNLILTPENMPFGIDAETVQETHRVLCEARTDDGERLAFFLVLKDAQATRIFPNGIHRPHCEHGWPMMTALLNWAAENKSTGITDKDFSGVIEGVILEQGVKTEARGGLPGVLFGEKPEEQQGPRPKAGSASSMFYAMADAGEIPMEMAGELHTFCLYHPDFAIKFLGGMSRLLGAMTEMAIEHPDAEITTVSAGVRSPSCPRISRLYAFISGSVVSSTCPDFAEMFRDVMGGQDDGN
ncbi:hypothetical protein KJ903_03665 [Patescibacteria group bacterium]|nr:hypothetical protein [Patescibacteria group bacterium]